MLRMREGAPSSEGLRCSSAGIWRAVIVPRNRAAKFKLLVVIATTIIGCSPALAYHGVPYASATISGTQEKTLIHKQKPGDYTVCVEWSKYGLQLTYDANSMDIEPGDCLSVEASRISNKGKSEDEFSRAVIYDHTYRQYFLPGMAY